MRTTMHTMLTTLLVACGAPVDPSTDDVAELPVGGDPSDPGPDHGGPGDVPRSVGVVVVGSWADGVDRPIAIDTDADSDEPIEVAPEDTGRVGSPPSCAILEPLPGTVLPGGVPSHFEGAVDDPDGDVATAIWSSDRWGAMVIGLEFSFILPAGAHVVTLDVTDDAGHHCSKAVDLVVDP